MMSWRILVSMHYQRFVIISHLRSGTHLLRTALESHPAIKCQTEVFNSDNSNLPYSLETPTQQVLDEWVYKDIEAGISHAGFVLQAYHPHALAVFPGIRANPKWADIWEILAAMPELKIIHLQRNNLLQRHLSHLQARQSGQWHNWNARQLEHISLLEHPPEKHIDQYQAPRPLMLDAERLQQDFLEVEYWHRFVARHFQQHSYMQIAYEDLQQHYPESCSKILQFLGLAPVPLNSGVHKLEKRSLCESIGNYDALKQYFAGSPWQHFFED